MRALALAAIASVAGLGACSDVPASPTYADDVRAVLRANCSQCHGAPDCTRLVAGRRFRLDRWHDAGGVLGAGTTSDRIVARAVDEGTMPPDAPLTERQRELLRRWQRAGGPRGDAIEGEPPVLALTTAVPAGEPEGGVLRLGYELRDPDGDAVTWDVGWRRDGAPGVEGLLRTGVESGAGAIDVDLGVLPEGRYQLVGHLHGELDDRAITVTLGAPITIGPRDAAPTVALELAQVVRGATTEDPDTLALRWRADDADTTGALTAAVRLRGESGDVVTLAAGLDARTGTEPLELPAALRGLHDVELVVSDGALERQARLACPIFIP